MREDGCPGRIVAVGTRHRREAGELMPCHPRTKEGRGSVQRSEKASHA